MMRPPRGGDLDREPGVALADDIGQVGDLLGLRYPRVDPVVESGLSLEPALQLLQCANPEDLDTVDQAGLGQVHDGHHHGGPALLLGGQHRG